MCLLPSTCLLLQLSTLDTCSCLCKLKCMAFSSQVGSVPRSRAWTPVGLSQRAPRLHNGLLLIACPVGTLIQSQDTMCAAGAAGAVPEDRVRRAGLPQHAAVPGQAAAAHHHSRHTPPAGWAEGREQGRLYHLAGASGYQGGLQKRAAATSLKAAQPLCTLQAVRTAGSSALQFLKPGPTQQPRSSLNLQMVPLAASHPTIQAPHLCSAGPPQPCPGAGPRLLQTCQPDPAACPAGPLWAGRRKPGRPAAAAPGHAAGLWRRRAGHGRPA